MSSQRSRFPGLRPAGHQVAVIDVQRVLTESDRGKEAIQKLKLLQEAKINEVKLLQQKLAALHDQIDKQHFALSAEKLEELKKQAEDAQISLNAPRTTPSANR